MRRPPLAHLAAVVAGAVVVCLAVLIGGEGAGAQLARITGADIRDQSVTGRDVKRNSLTGRQINEKRVGKVPKARNADRLGGQTSRALRDGCPPNTRPVSNTCFELTARAKAAYSTAAAECEVTSRDTTGGRRLPSHDELMTAIGDYGIALDPAGELTRNVYPPAGPGRKVDVLVVTQSGAEVGVVPDNAQGERAYRCVVARTNSR